MCVHVQYIYICAITWLCTHFKLVCKGTKTKTSRSHGEFVVSAYVTNVCMYVLRCCLFLYNAPLSPLKNLCCCCCFLRSLRMRNAHLLRQHVAKISNNNNNESRRIVLICHNLLFLLCLLCPRTRSAANCAAHMRERRCWTQPNVRARSVCVVCWHCDADVATRRRESAAESGKEREQTWEHRVVCFFAREYAYDCVTMCVRVCVCLHCQRFVHSFFVISSY